MLKHWAKKHQQNNWINIFIFIFQKPFYASSHGFLKFEAVTILQFLKKTSTGTDYVNKKQTKPNVKVRNPNTLTNAWFIVLPKN